MLQEYMEQYTKEEFDSFVKSMKRMSDVLRSQKPDYVFAPIIGSVPLVDTLSIIDRHFPIENVEYPPNSSRFINREEIIDKWYSKFIDTNYSGDKMSIICVDEVISGSSASKGYKEFRKVLNQSNKKSLEKKVNYKMLGIGEKPKNRKRNHNFTKLVNQKKAKVFETKRIITADNIALNPIRLKHGETNKQGRQTYLPKIHSFNYSQSYLDFLHNIATYCGVNPDTVTPVNVLKISQSLDKYLA